MTPFTRAGTNFPVGGGPRARRSEVIVVGGGPAGACTAWALATAGLDVTLLDRARFPRDKACAEYLSPQASRILHAMGALEPVERAGAAQLAGMRIHAPSGDVIHGEFAAAHGFPGFRDHGLALRRRVLDPLLLDRARAAGVRVVEGERVLDLRRDGTGRVTGVETTNGRSGAKSRPAALVVGADGLRSVVARRLGLARTGRLWQRRLAIVAHYEHVEGMNDCGELHVEHDGYVGIAHVGGGIANVAVVVPLADARGAAGDAAGFLERWVRRRPHLAGRFAAARRVSPAMVTGPFASAARRPWAPGAALVGDAADFFDPFTGEGIYAALRGGELLAPLAAEAAAHSSGGDHRRAEQALREYARVRRRTFGGKWIVEKLVGASVASPVLFNHVARVLARRRDMADLLVGVIGDFVPPRQVLRPAFMLQWLRPSSFRS